MGNDDAGEVNAAFVSLLASCQLHGIEPWSYLRDLFCLMPGTAPVAQPTSSVITINIVRVIGDPPETRIVAARGASHG